MFEKRLWVALINGQELKLYKTKNGKSPYQVLTLPLPHIKHEQEMLRDKPGRSFSSGSQPPSSHVMIKSTSPKRKLKNQAAKLAAHFLYSQYLQEKCHGIYLVATNEILGLLRPQLHKTISHLIIQEVTKDLVHTQWENIRKHLPYAL